MKRLHRIFAFLIMPALGYLLGATLFNYFGDKVEPGDLTTATSTALVLDCVERGPVAWRGLGYWDRCSVSVGNSARGTSRTLVVNGLFEREDIGKRFAVEGVARGGRLIPEERPYYGLGGFLLIPFGMLWLYLLAKVAVPAMPERFTRIPEPGEQKPPPEPEPEPEEPKPDPSLGATVASGWVFGYGITVDPDGMGFGRKKRLTWAEIDNVRINTFDVVYIQPRNGKRVRIGPIPGEAAAILHKAMKRFGQVPYSRAK